jgi:hypothetical protein
MRITIPNALAALIAVAIGAIRPFLVSHPLSLEGSYEAFAHLFIGALIGAWFANRDRLFLGLVIGLSLVELVSAITKR